MAKVSNDGGLVSLPNPIGIISRLTNAEINIGPLTTTFTAPSQCNYPSLDFNRGTSPGALTDIAIYNPSWELGTKCLPYGGSVTRGYYSPGVCPSGWSSKAITNGPEKIYNCCPNFAPNVEIITFAQSQDVVSCLGTVTIGPSSTVALYVNGSLSAYTMTPLPSALSTLIPYGKGVQVRFKDSDFPNGGPSSNTASVSNTLSSQQSPLLTGSSSSTSPPSVSQTASASGLSTGAKVGVAVGVVIAVLIFFVIAFVLIRRYRQRRVSTSDEVDEAATNGKAELPGSSAPYVKAAGGAVKEKPELEDTTREISAIAAVAARNDDTGPRSTVVELSTEQRPEPIEIATEEHGTVNSAHKSVNGAVEMATRENGISFAAQKPVELETEKSASSSSLAPAAKSEPLSTGPKTQSTQSDPVPSYQPLFDRESGPVPTAADLFPAVSDAQLEDDFEYEERRLQQRRELIAEKERLARDEDALRARKAKAKKKGA